MTKGLTRRTLTRFEELSRTARNTGMFVRTYSPGDGVTRYRFFDAARCDEEKQDYFGPASGAYTALGLKEAWAFIEGRLSAR